MSSQCLRVLPDFRFGSDFLYRILMQSVWCSFSCLSSALVSNIKGTTRVVARWRRLKKPVSLWHRYTKGNLYLPILTLLYLWLFLLMRFVLYRTTSKSVSILLILVKERQVLEDAIYAWDDTATLYRRVSACRHRLFVPDALYSN